MKFMKWKQDNLSLETVMDTLGSIPEPQAKASSMILEQEEGYEVIVAIVIDPERGTLVRNAPRLREELQLAVTMLEAVKTGAALLPAMRQLLKETEIK